MAGIGDEISTHRRQPFLFCQVSQRDENDGTIVAALRQIKRGDDALEASIQRCANIEDERAPLSLAQSVGDSRGQLGVARGQREMVAKPHATEYILRSRIGVQHDHLLVERQRGIDQRTND